MCGKKKESKKQWSFFQKTKNMKFQIIQFREYTNTKNELFFNCKIFLGWYGGVWISELDYKEKPYLIQITNNDFNPKGDSNLDLLLKKWSDENPERTLNLVEPIEENYVIENKEGKNGAFKVLIPKLEKHININNDPLQSTKTKYELIDINQIIDKTKAQNVDDINQNGSMSLNELLGSTNPQWYSNNDRFNIESKTESDPVKIDTIITNDNIDIASSKDDTLISSKEKFSFINNIIDLSVKNNVDNRTRKKLINLIENEISKTELVEKEIIHRVISLESKIDTIFNPELLDISKNHNEEHSDLKKYNDPSFLSKFLLEYNQDPILKITCHLIDQSELNKINEILDAKEFSFESLYRKIISSFVNLEKKHPNANYKIKALIRGYLTGKDKKGVLTNWSSDKISISWNSSDLIEWTKKNPQIPPNPDDGLTAQLSNLGFEFDKITTKLFNNNIQTFSGLVLFFKHLFHIRFDNSLKSIIDIVNDNENFNKEICFVQNNEEFKSNIELFTDVDKLIQAYKIIIKLIVEVSKEPILEKPNVKLSFYENNGDIIFSIHHLNSVYQKSMINTKERIGQTCSNLIVNQINGMCDLILSADFGDENYATINLWDGKPREHKLLNNFTGVEHKLIFKR